MEMSIGLDVSVQETSVCALGRDGEIVAETTMVTDPQVLAHGLSRLPGSMGAVGLEAGPMSPWLCKGLRDRGYTVVLMETRRIKAALKAVPVKTDRRDALGIAHLLRMGWFQPVHCKSDRSQAIRVLLGARRSLVQSITRLELSMRGLLRNFGLRLGAPGRGREGGLRRLCADADIGSSLPLPRLFRAVQPLLRTRAQMRTELHGTARSGRF